MIADRTVRMRSRNMGESKVPIAATTAPLHKRANHCRIHDSSTPLPPPRITAITNSEIHIRTLERMRAKMIVICVLCMHICERVGCGWSAYDVLVSY